ncbi:MAG TPA: efflux RND transporter periplasmic adaptor subunit [Planctomycetota bacterium]|nr:efflux RND transporter periplasmic adaptor subunit [Planctomycetota bacterium]
MKYLRLCLQVLLPLAVLVAGATLVRVIQDNQKAPVVDPPPARGPLVRTQLATATDLRIDVDTQGTVEPFRTVALSSYVSGRVVAKNAVLRAGGHVAADEVLLEIDPADFELDIVQQEAAVARAELHLLQERAEADAALRVWQQLEGDRPADPLVLRGPQVADAEKALAAAKAQLERSRLDLARTKVKAPFAGRVHSASAEVGEFVQAGQSLAVLFDTTFVEARLPIPVADAAFLELPAPSGAVAGGPEVQLTAQFAGRRHTWTGVVVRTEGEIDRRTRQMTLVARVAAGGEQTGAGTAPPLLVGMFVQARVSGRSFAGVVTVPRAALRDGTCVWIVDAEQRLRRREVQVLRAEADRVVLGGGLAAGERICITSLETPTDGMPVRIVEAKATVEPAPHEAR